MPLKKDKIFLLPHLELKHFLFLFFFLISILKKIVQTFYNKNKSISWDFLALYLYDAGDLLSIIPYIIMRIRTKDIKKNSNNNNNDIIIDSKSSIKTIENNTENDVKNGNTNDTILINNTNIKILYYEPEDKKNKCYIFLKIILYTLVDFIAQISKVVYYFAIHNLIKVELDDLNSTLIFFIISTMLFSKIMLHYELLRHHYFSFVIYILCLIVLSVLDILEIKQKNDKNGNLLYAIIYLIILIFKNIFYSFSDVLMKVIFLYDFISPYTLLLIKAIIEFFYLGIFSIPFIFKTLYYAKDIELTIFDMIAKDFKESKYIGIAIGFTINSFFYNILIFQIINVFSPNHFIVAKVIENIGVFALNYIIKGNQRGQKDEELEKKIYFIVIKAIMFVLLIFSSIIFNEYLVINICGLAKKTKLFLDYEAKIEIENRKSSDISSNSSENNYPLIKDSDVYK